jgi:acyl-CoA hydrolase
MFDPGRACATVLRAIGLLPLAMLVGCSDPPRQALLAPGATVLALGDSLTHGTGASVETSYPAVLARSTGWNVVNAGVPGDTAGEGCARLPALLDEHRPQLVLVLLGGNDFLQRRPEQGIREALAACVRHARRAGSQVVLMSVPRPGLGGPAQAALYTDLAKAERVPVVDPGLADLLAQPALRSDRVHLNAEGYAAMASAVAQGLRNEGLLPR